VYVKLGVHTRAEAARKALSEELDLPLDVSREA
jgi:DNA-binding NarL/FixJ family response regulator